MLARATTRILNHVLTGEGWARERLRAFSGQHLRLVGGPLALDLAVDHDGLFRSADASAGEAPAVTIELPGDAPFRLLNGGREAVFAAARLTGAADFAETLAFVFRNLRWDVEDDLSGLLGDVTAHRLVRSGAAVLAWQRQAAKNLAANAAEYLSEESRLVVPGREVADFRDEVQVLRADLDQLEQRLARL
jgi:ubiquinone biosynthesis protein UbiJ